MTKSHWTRRLKQLGACNDALEWAQSQSDPHAAWETCPRGDWLLWIADRLEVDQKLLAIAACRCARTALVHVPPGEDRPLRAIEVAEAWTRGEATDEEVAAARAAARVAASDAAWAAAWDAAWAAARDAAWAAAWDAASDAASDAARAAARAAAWAAAWAAARDAAWAAARDAAWAAARDAALADHAVIVREVIPWSAIETLIAAPA